MENKNSSEKDDPSHREAENFKGKGFWIDPENYKKILEKHKQKAKEQAESIKAFFAKKEGGEYSAVISDGGATELLKDIKSSTSLTSKITSGIDEAELPTALPQQLSNESDFLVETLAVPHSKHLRANSLPTGLGVHSYSSLCSVPSFHEFPPIKYSIRIGNTPNPLESKFVLLSVDMNCTAQEIIDQYLAKSQQQVISSEWYRWNLFQVKNGTYEQRLHPDDRPILIQNKWLHEFGYEPSEDGIDKLGEGNFGFYFHFWISRLSSQSPITTEKEVKVHKIAEEKANGSILEMILKTDNGLEIEDSLKDLSINIDLSGKNLYCIPIGLLYASKNIINLDLSRNQMLNLSVEFCRSCRSINTFRFTNNSLDAVPYSMTYFPQSLTVLDLSMNYIKEDSLNFITELVNLTHLFLQSNRLRKIPSTLCNLKKLVVLNLSNNLIQKIPNEISDLGRIAELDLSFNFINEVPSSLVKLSQLEHLNLSNNHLKTLPNNFYSIPKLKTINLRYNLLENCNGLFNQNKINTMKGDEFVEKY